MCIATLNDFQAGLSPWDASLTHQYGLHRVVWNVSNRLEEEQDGAYSGEMLTIDATTGAVLESSSYGVQF